MPIPLAIPLAVAGVSALSKGIGGYVQHRKAQKRLDELSTQPIPEYQVSPELQSAYGQAQSLAQQGFMPEEKAAFQQQSARQQAGALRSGLDVGGGNMARALSAGLQAGSIEGVNQFAAAGADLRRQGIRYAGDLARAMQQQKNLATQEKIAQRMQLEGAYGQASAMGMENMFGAVSEGANLAIAGMGGIGARDTEGLTDEELFQLNKSTSGGLGFKNTLG